MPGLLTRTLQPAFVAGCLVLAGCMNSSAPLAPTPTGAVSYGAPVAEPIFTSDGIEAGATGREIDFNRAEPGAIEAMSKLMGQGPVSVSQACSGLRAARWKDGTTLFFALKPYDPPAFVGWRRASGQAGQTCAI